MKNRILTCVAAALVCMVLSGGHATAQDSNETVQGLIVKLRPAVANDRKQAQSAERTEAPATALARRVQMRLRASRELGGRQHLLQIDTTASGESLQTVMQRLRADPDVEYVQPDRRRRVNAVPNDPNYVSQWYLQGTQASATRANDAWDTTTGSSNVVVAILDTGVRFDHPDLRRVSQGGRLLDGYDFISNPAIANDGGGRDGDPSDPGDWVNSTDLQQNTFQDCSTGSSSWHGTRVAGIIGARSNNADGIAGMSWQPLLLPVRVLGKCGGFDSDIIPAMRWAAGIPVSGVPNNPNPASIINMSLGSSGACSAAYQDAINEVTARGVLVVVSAGNDTGHEVNEPANCSGVLAVAGLRHAGTKVGFSSIGPQVGISAPGGNCVNTSGACLFSLDTTTNSGTTTPLTNTYTDQFNYNVGTSFSSPIVSGAAALVRSVNTRLSPQQVIRRLQTTARAFPQLSGVSACIDPALTNADQLECNCTGSTCGAGMLDAAGAVTAALKPFVIITASTTNASQGQTVNLSGVDSFASDGRSVTAYAWSVVSQDGGTAPILANAGQPAASFVAPAGGAIVLRLTVTDDQGVSDSADVTVLTPAPPTTPPNSGGNSDGGGGGGGVFGFELLALLLARRLLNATR